MVKRLIYSIVISFVSRFTLLSHLAALFLYIRILFLLSRLNIQILGGFEAENVVSILSSRVYL